jgi:hypothetical protein
VKEFSQFDTTADVEEKILDQILVDDEALVYNESTLTVHEFSRREDDLQVDYRLFVTNLEVSIQEDTVFTFTEDGFETDDFDTLLEHIVFGYYEDEQVSMIGFYDVTTITNQPTVSEIALGALIALLFVGVYLVFRTSIATAFATLLVAGSTSLVTLGLFIVTRIPSSSILALSLLLVSFITTILVLAIFARSKALLSTIKDRKLIVDDYTLAIKKATSQSASFVFLTLLTLLYPALTFVGVGPSPLQGLFASVLVGVALSAWFVTGIIPISFKPFYRLFKGVGSLITLPVRKANVKVTTSGRSNEPQESTFIGIND